MASEKNIGEEINLSPGIEYKENIIENPIINSKKL